MQKLNKVRLFLLLAIICSGALVAGVVTYRVVTKEQHPAAGSKKLPPNIGVSLDAARLTDSVNGVKQWEVVATTAQFDKDRNATVLADLKATFLSRKAPKVITVTARAGEYDHGKKKILLSGGVKGAADDPQMEFSGASFIYDTVGRVLRSDDEVSFRDATISLRGKGFEMWPDSGRMHVHRKVEAVVAPTPKK